MLNYKTFEAGAPSTAVPMAAHVLKETLPQQAIDAQRTYGASARALVRSDLHPDLATVLRIEAGAAPTLRQFASLLAGRGADGRPLLGKQIQRATESLASEAGLRVDRFATVAEAQAIMAGLRADTGAPMPMDRTASVYGRFAALYGADASVPVDTLLERVRDVRDAVGEALVLRRYRKMLEAYRAAIGHLHCVVSAEKTLSIAWAAAASVGERLLIAQCHDRAVARTMAYLEGFLGYTRRGKAGTSRDDGCLAYIAMTHYTSRPTWAPQEFGTPRIKILGDPHIHSHVIVPNVLLADDGHIGALNLAEIRGRVHQGGAYYTACLADELRSVGIDVIFDGDNGGFRIAGVPDNVRVAFSKRTLKGVENAKEFAELTDEEWDGLCSRERAARAKRGVQGDPRGAKTDDIADFEQWRNQMRRLNWTRESFVDLDRSTKIDDPEARLQIAEDVAAQLVEARAAAGESVDLKAVRLAATRGLIASGIHTGADVSIIAQRLARRFTGRDIQQAAAAVVERERPIVRRLDDAPIDRDLARSFIDSQRAAGRAQLVEGGERGVVAATAKLWVEFATGKTIGCLPTIGVGTADKAALFTDEIRRLRRTRGELGPDVLDVDCVDEGGYGATIRLAIGDPLRLTGRTEDEFAARGRGVASVRAPVQMVVDVKRNGALAWLCLQTPGGRIGRLWWDHVRAVDNRYRISLGYVVPGSAIAGHRGDRIEAYPGGTDHAGPLRSKLRGEEKQPTFLIVDAAAERRSIAQKRGVDATTIGADDIWANVAENLSASRSAVRLVRRAHKIALSTAMTMLRALARFELRIKAGLTPYPGRRRVRLHDVDERPRTATVVVGVPSPEIAAGDQVEVVAKPATSRPAVGRLSGDDGPDPRERRRRRRRRPRSSSRQTEDRER